MIEIREVSKRYGRNLAVDRASADIRKGRITSLIGPNGSGKSTLLSVVSRLIPMDDGRVCIDGKELDQWKSCDLARRISILKQTNHLNLRLSVRDLVAFGRFPYSNGRLFAEDVQQIDQALHYMNLWELQHKFIDQLSGGERQRAFIAMVIAQDTDYIFLDEPLNNLDMTHSVHIMKILRQLVDELGKTIVIVLHDINFASCYSDDLIAMKNGRVAHCGPVSEMIDSAVLKDVYDMDIRIQEIDCQRVCMYYW